MQSKGPGAKPEEKNGPDGVIGHSLSRVLMENENDCFYIL